ncbi:MAG: D-Ala-D-Ala carboxypeptidase family metallohydrolase [Gemmatimonadaceae bacterium]
MGSSLARDAESTASAKRLGLSVRGERALNVVGTIVLCVFAVGWGVSISTTHRLPSPASAGGDVTSATAEITSSLTHEQAPTTAFLTDAALNAIANRILAGARGASGKLKAAIEPSATALRPDVLPNGASLAYANAGHVESRPTAAGIWSVLLNIGNAMRPISTFNVIAMLPFSAKKNGRVGLYYIGTWPSERGAVGPAKAPPSAYATPSGFIEVTQANAATAVSEHFTLRDFLTHDQPNVWPKYIVLQQKLVDKLELVLTDLSEHGYDTHGVKVMSGFRTPQYNHGGGNTAGRANLSRHMYGDAADIYIDNDGDGQMDDLDHDGKISIGDARVIEAAVDRVESAHPELVGGAGVYTAAPGHGPFIHIDVRGYRARWMGTSGG